MWAQKYLSFASWACLAATAVYAPAAANAAEVSLHQTETNRTIAQIGFQQALHWDFVGKNAAAGAQIAQLTPIGIAAALQLPQDQVTFSLLRMWEMPAEAGYNATVVMFYVPGNPGEEGHQLVGKLKELVQDRESRLYTNPYLSPSVKQLMGLIDETIEVEVDQ